MAVNVPHEFTQHQLCFVAPLSELLDLFRGEVGFLLRAIKQSLDSLETPSLVDRCIHSISVRGEEQSVVLVDSCLSLSLVFCGLLLVELSHPVRRRIAAVFRQQRCLDASPRASAYQVYPVSPPAIQGTPPTGSHHRRFPSR